jgi:uncharacterized protein YggE
MKFATFVLSALFLASLSFAQPAAPERRVTALGTGEMQVAPDMAKVTVEAVNNDGSPVDAAMETRRAMATIVAAARRLIRDQADLKTTRLAVNPEYEWVEGKRKFRGYNATQSLEITIRDVSKVDSLLGDLIKAKVTTLGNLEFFHSKADLLRREALLHATRNARDNAAKICEALGLVCDEVAAVRMAGTSGPAPVAVEAQMFRMAKDGGNSMPVHAGMLTFSATVEADFKVK